MPPFDIAALLLVGGLTLIFVVGRLRFLGGPAASIEAVVAWGSARGHTMRGDGTAAPLELVGAVRGRRWTLGLLVPPSGEAVLLLGVDCEGADRGPGGGPQVEDGVLVVRIERPPADLFALERLDRVIEELVVLAEQHEAEAPGAPPLD